jgi:hypothetical protein
VGDVVTFTVTDGTGKNVTASSTIYDMDYSVVKNAKYKTTKEGTFKFFATRNGYTSNTLTVTVGDGGSDEPGQTEGTAFLHKVLVIDHTGVNCGYCPNAIDNLRNLESKTSWGPYYNEVSCHAGSYASGDPASSGAATALNEFQGNNGLINGYPTIAVNFYNRASSYSYSNIANTLQNVVKKAGADVGISLSVEKGSSKVICSVEGCKAEIMSEEIPVIGYHNFDVEGEVTEEPTCTGTGTMTYTCAVCQRIRVEEIPALNFFQAVPWWGFLLIGLALGGGIAVGTIALVAVVKAKKKGEGKFSDSRVTQEL